ncbi:hypothetical protein N658DRAFT_157354 [Parathielavia hyrcaniae]|uniref:Uncharacterized protein n=1 Tax=Parathielavia hyrcaniae TaxID=113614 RepID=A0AAN6PXA5_9PEZI|nr:hypothetical protein N658DRAFT_157354 [Parathielavia hyrcaniae]
MAPFLFQARGHIEPLNSACRSIVAPGFWSSYGDLGRKQRVWLFILPLVSNLILVADETLFPGRLVPVIQRAARIPAVPYPVACQSVRDQNPLWLQVAPVAYSSTLAPGSVTSSLGQSVAVPHTMSSRLTPHSPPVQSAAAECPPTAVFGLHDSPSPLRLGTLTARLASFTCDRGVSSTSSDRWQISL